MDSERATQKKLRVFVMSLLRKIKDLSRKDKKRDADIRKILNIGKDTVDVIQKRKL